MSRPSRARPRPAVFLLGFVALLAVPGLVRSNDSVRAASRLAVSKCAERVAVGATAMVERNFRALCRKNPADPAQDLYQSDSIAYRVSRVDAGFRAEADVNLLVLPATTPKARKELILARTQECMPIINQYWKRYGIDVDFHFTLNTGVNNANTVAVTDASGRSNSRNFYFQGLDNENRLPTGQVVKGGPGNVCRTQCALFAAASACQDICEPVREREYCVTMVHELGHRLGLPDEYADPGLCPDREFVSTESYPWSIMAVPFIGFLDTPLPSIGATGGAEGLDTQLAEFFPRHVDAVLAPLCGTH